MTLRSSLPVRAPIQAARLPAYGAFARVLGGSSQMAINAFGRGREAGYESQSDSNPSASSSSSASGGLTAFIDQGSEFEGKLSFRDTVRIDGRFHGEITSENTLIVGESGEIDAEIRSNTVVVSGTVTGNVIAETKVVLHKSARVNGDIQTPSIVVEEGAMITGKINMSGASGNKSVASLKAVATKNDANAKTDAKQEARGTDG
jgi:cytoskeletal protein CcmA (bactofilin family)